jgi:hypothetical protein
MSTAQITALANTRSGDNLTPAKGIEIKDRTQKVGDGLESLLNYMNTLSINNVALSFQDIYLYESYKNQKVEILDIWKNSFNNDFNEINANINTLK